MGMLQRQPPVPCQQICQRQPPVPCQQSGRRPAPPTAITATDPTDTTDTSTQNSPPRLGGTVEELSARSVRPGRMSTTSAFAVVDLSTRFKAIATAASGSARVAGLVVVSGVGTQIRGGSTSGTDLGLTTSTIGVAPMAVTHIWTVGMDTRSLATLPDVVVMLTGYNSSARTTSDWRQAGQILCLDR